MLKRTRLLEKLERGVKLSPVTALLGPRQCGKTTLVRTWAKNKKCTFFDLENPVDASMLQNPQKALEAITGVVVIDEIQRRPELFALLRTLADRKPLKCKFILLGSASPEILRHSSESLAGRIFFVDINGFSLEETGDKKQNALWLRGGFPRSFLAKSENDSWQWRINFVRTFLERDIPQLESKIPADTLRRFLTMVAHYHGQVWNASEVAASLGWSHSTASRYLDLLSGAFILRRLSPWFENIGKRLLKAPKIYIRDCGILHYLLNLPSWRAVQSHPKYGASWEGFAIEQLLNVSGAHDAYYYATHGGAELDLFLPHKGKRLGFEFKASDTPKVSKSMHIALSDLKLDKLFVVSPGDKSYELDKNIICLSLSEAIKTVS